MKNVLCLGECMVELAPVGDGIYRQAFAGDTFNAAWYLRRLVPDDWTVAYGTCVGADAISDRMVDFMVASGIDVSGVKSLEKQTVGLYMISLDKGERSFSYWRSTSAARSLAADPAWLDSLLEGRSVILFSGISVAILPDNDRPTLFAALARARANGSTIVFDPNMRPRLWPDNETMCAAVTEAARNADIVLPSFDEESAFFGDVSPRATAHRYRSLGAGVVVVKNGIEDTIGNSPEEGEVVVSPKVVTPVDTTAAGDSFNAGFLAARLLGSDLKKAIETGGAVSAQVVQAPGALVEISDNLA